MAAPFISALGTIMLFSFLYCSRDNPLDPHGTNYSPDSLTIGLVGYWKFDETSGTIAFDCSGNGYNGTLMHGPTRVAGKTGKALDFNGTSNYVVIAATSALDNLTAMTFSAWIYPRVDSHWHVIDKGDGDKRLYAEGLHLILRGIVRDSSGVANSESDSNTVVLNTWQHVAMTWSLADSTIRLYRNGTEVAYSSIRAVNTGSPLDDSSHPFTIGVEGALESITFFNGLIDEVRIYNRVLSANQITALYNH
jgi:hypothetical protein